MNHRSNTNHRSKKTTTPQVIERPCYFCTHNMQEVDYKNIRLFQRMISNYAKILPRGRTGTCSKHQRKAAQAIKRARFMALVPFTNR